MRALLGEAALPALRALKRARARTVLPAMHRVRKKLHLGLVGPEAALNGYWMELPRSNQAGRPLSMGDALRLRSEESATPLHSSAPALLHAMRTHLPMAAAPHLNRARATYPGGMSELVAALHLLHPPDLEVGEVTIFVEGEGRTSSRPRLNNPVYNGTGPTPPYDVVCDAFPREPAWCPALSPGTHEPRSWAHPHLFPPLFRTRGANHRGQVLWKKHPGTPLLLPVVATCRDPDQVIGATPTHLYGAASVPPPPSRRPWWGTG